MKHLTEKFWFLTAALCVLATASTFVVVTGNHQISEESSTELVDVVEETEAIAHRNRRRVERTYASAKGLKSSSVINTKLRACCRFFKPAKERENLNGLGGYLLT